MKVPGRAVAATVLLVAATGAACGGDDPGTASAPATSATVATPTAPARSTAPAAPPGVDVREGSDPCGGDDLPALAAFDAASGALTWTVCSDAEAHRRVLGATEEAAYVAESVETGTALVAYDVVDGREVWRRPLATSWIGWPKGPIAGDGIIVVADGTPEAPVIVGLDAATGEPRWQVDQATVHVTTPDLPVPATTMSGTGMPPRQWFPVAGTEHVAVLISNAGELAGLDRLSGAPRWDVSALGGGDESGDVAGLAAAAVAGDRVVLPAGSETVAIDAVSGAELWRAPRLDDPWADDAHVAGGQPPSGRSQPASEIAALDVATGAPASVVPGRESYGDRLAVGDGGVFVLGPDAGTAIIGYDLATGAVRWTIPAGRSLGEPHTVLGDLVLTLWEGSLGALATGDGAVRWAWHRPVGSDWMNDLGTNSSTVFVAVNSVPFGD